MDFVSIGSWLERFTWEGAANRQSVQTVGTLIAFLLVLTRGFGRKYRLCVTGRVVVVWTLGLWERTCYRRSGIQHPARGALELGLLGCMASVRAGVRYVCGTTGRQTF